LSLALLILGLVGLGVLGLLKKTCLIYSIKLIVTRIITKSIRITTSKK
jgi:hypothetical protein